MTLIGVLGGIASGKSLVSRRLADLGAQLLDADRIGHEVLREPAVKQALRDRWGPGIFSSDGEIDRRSVAEIVFGAPPDGPRELRFLEVLVHPRIGERIRKRLEDSRRTGQVRTWVLDAPLMLEAGWDRMCDVVVFVDAPRELRLQRACRRGWSEADFAARESAQQTLDAKRQRADVIFDNSSTVDHLYGQIDRFWQAIVSRDR
jgi:dephospho-CoA kinase